VRDVWNYVLALLRRWRAWVTSSLIIAAFGWTPALFGVHVPAQLVGLALLLGVPVAGFYAWREEHRRARDVGSKQQAAVDGLAGLRGQGRQLYDAPDIPSGGWTANWEEWSRKVAEYLGTHFTEAVVQQFLHPDPLPPAELPDPQGPRLRVLDQQLKYLSSVVERGTLGVKP
jgi:hypothetical protein